MSIYMTSVAIGALWGQPANWGYGNLYKGYVVLRDLDNPSRSWYPTEYNNGDNDEVYYSFRGVTATRFSLTMSKPNETPSVFDEIKLGEPDE